MECLSGITDETVIVDTGSVDKSPDIASQRGARIITEPWRDDFAYARNIGLDAAFGDWILYIDADERVEVTGDLAAVLANSKAVAANVSFQASQRLTPYREHRLFRNRPDIRFRGAIHETVMPDIRHLVDEAGLAIVEAPLTVRHLGYDGEITHKHHRNHPMLVNAVAGDPGRVYLWHALGECELGLNRAEAAEAAWRRGLEVLHQRAPAPGDALIYSDLLSLHYSDICHRLDDAENLVGEANRHHQDDPLILWWTAQHLSHQGRFSEARAKAAQLIEIGPDGPDAGHLGYDRALFGEWGYGLLGTCFLNEGRPDKALEWLSKAEAANPDNPEIRTKRALAEASL
jgi:tetratricopeptide (TPR) repeat protein